VSLTVNEVDGPVFGVNIVPHTLAATVFGGYRTGARVNLEVDIVARYLERLVGESGGLSRERLEEYGFGKGH
jgi:riboflavin synthase